MDSAITEPLVTIQEVHPRVRRWPYLVLSVVVGLVTTVLLVGGSAVGYLAWLNGRPMHGVGYLRASLALADEPTRRAIVERQNQSLADHSLVVVVNDETLQVPLSEFQPVFNTEAVVRASTAFGQVGTPIDRATTVLKTLWSGADLLPVVEFASIPASVIAASSNQTAAVDATFALVDNQLVVVPHRVGRTLVVDQLYVDARDALTTDQNIVARFDEDVPSVTTEALTPLVSRVSFMVGLPLELKEGKRSVRYDQAELLSWLKPTVGIDGAAELVFDQTVIASALEKLEKLVNRSAMPTQVSARDGSILTAGRAGTVVNRETTVAAILTELERRAEGGAATPVTAVVSTIEPTQQAVEQDTTPGLYPGKYIEVDLSSQRLYQYEGESLVQQYRVSTGKWSTPTPLGTFAINNKVPRAYSRPYGLYMPNWMAFLGSSYGLHELPEWPDGTKEGQSHLGHPVSHGCIRLGVGDARVIYDWAEVGTPVVVHN